MLVMVAFGTAPGAAFSQDAMGSAVRDWERRTAQAARARVEQRARMEQSRAHAQMPDTMYASTPDPSTPPHPFPLDVTLKSAPERAAPSAKASSKSASGRSHRIALFPAASRWAQKGYQGFARIINRSETDGEVRIEAFDDAGMVHGPVMLRLGAGKTVHFNSNDLEGGNAGKGLSGGVGVGTDDWRLELSSGLDIEVLSYSRTTDGFLTAMHDVVPAGETGHRVATFNPGGNVNQVSRLRLVNPGTKAARVSIEGIDDAGEASDGAVVVSVPAGASRTVSAKELEAGGRGLTGMLGRGTGKWQLVVSSEQSIEATSLLSSPTGHLTNLSTVPVRGDGAHTVGLFPSAVRWTQKGYQGFARIINRSKRAGEVRIEAVDDGGMVHGPVTLSLEAEETVHFNSDDLEGGNAGKGLSGGTGPPGRGDWRLKLSSGLDIEVLSYIRTTDGFLTSMHDVAPVTTDVHRVVVFNPGDNVNQVSQLRLINPGTKGARVSIKGIDDEGEASDGEVVVALAPGTSRILGAEQLEAGRGLNGALGDGAKKWRLEVSANQPIEVMSLLSSPTGHLTNLSTVPAPGKTAAEVFAERISGPIVQGKCIVCHIPGGLAAVTRLHFVGASNADHVAHNLGVFENFVSEVEDGATLILNKIQGVAHGGGVQVAAGTPEFADMERFLGLLGAGVESASLTPQTLFDTVTLAPPRKVLRRAALIFAGRTPTEAEYAAVEGGGLAALRATIRGLMTGPEFHEFLIRAANDRLLTDREGNVIDNHKFVAFSNEEYRLKAAAHASGDERDRFTLDQWIFGVAYGTSRASLELIAHVVEHDLPYTEILTADYIMANPQVASAYGASTKFDDPEDPHEFKPSKLVSYYREGDDFRYEYVPALDAVRIIDPGTLITGYPHAGILNTTVFLRRYPTTPTNRNRARSRWTYYHFLGVDIEKSASRTTDPVALADTNNPTMHNPACTVCHRILDPVAGAFQNYGDVGYYKDQRGGMDSLDEFYKRPAEEVFEIHADSWADRQTFSVTTWLPRDASFVLTHVNNNYCDDSVCGTLGRDFRLDEITVRNADSGVVVEEVGWADLDEHCLYDGRYNNGPGESDHYQWWGWDCTIPLSLPADNMYEIEVVTWADRAGDELAKIAIGATPYKEGDTWYRDMRTPGIAGRIAQNSDNSVQWLAQQIVADKRFAEATIKFWWPAIIGAELAEAPEDGGDADFEGLLLGATAQGAEVERLARGFRSGFEGHSPHNLKDLLVGIVLSKWFRADSVTDEDPVRRVALQGAGARRLLTPEELARKTAALTGVQWGRFIPTGCDPTPDNRCARSPSELDVKYRVLYGGIDSDGITERARDINTVMAGVAKRYAAMVSCPVVVRELYLLPEGKQRLFSGIDKHMTEPGAIRSKLVELHDELLGVQVTRHSPDVEAAYRLFVDVVERRRETQEDRIEFWKCDIGGFGDMLYFEGVLPDALTWIEDEYWPYYDIDWDRVGPFLDSIDWSDPHYVAQAWIVVLAYLMTDYRYLYL